MGGGPAKDHLLILVPPPLPSSLLTYLRTTFPQIDITHHNVPYTFDPDEVLRNLPKDVFSSTTLLCTFNAFPRHLSDAPNLQFIQLLSAGSNQIQSHPLYTSSDVVISTASGIHGPQIAEWCVMTALVHSHYYKVLYEQQKKHLWQVPDLSQRSVEDRVGKTVGILGYGSIGRQVGRVAQSMGMRVLAFTASEKKSAEEKRDRGFVVPGTGDVEGEVPEGWFSGLDQKSLHHFLGQGLDWLVVAVPLTKETRGFLSTREFEVLGCGGRKRPLLTNIARGPIVDQPALVKALKEGVLGGAALDVTDPEPLPEDSELWGMENVIVTPHVSGQGSTYTQRAFQVLEDNLGRRERGERLLNVVSREKGY